MAIGDNEVKVTHHGEQDWIFHLNRNYCEVTATKNSPFGIAINELDPNCHTTRHNHEAVEMFLIHSGEVEAHIGDQRYILKEGSTCFVPSFVDHNLFNTGKSVVKFTCIWWESV